MPEKRRDTRPLFAVAAPLAPLSLVSVLVLVLVLSSKEGAVFGGDLVVCGFECAAARGGGRWDFFCLHVLSVRCEPRVLKNLLYWNDREARHASTVAPR